MPVVADLLQGPFTIDLFLQSPQRFFHRFALFEFNLGQCRFTSSPLIQRRTSIDHFGLQVRKTEGSFGHPACQSANSRVAPRGRTTEFLRDAKAQVFRFFVLFVAFCRFSRTMGGRIPPEANKGKEELGQGQEGERGSMRRGISEYMGLLDTFSPTEQQNP